MSLEDELSNSQSPLSKWGENCSPPNCFLVWVAQPAHTPGPHFSLPPHLSNLPITVEKDCGQPAGSLPANAWEMVFLKMNQGGEEEREGR